MWFVEPGAAAQRLGDPPACINVGEAWEQAVAEAVGRETLAQLQGVAMGEWAFQLVEEARARSTLMRRWLRAREQRRRPRRMRRRLWLRRRMRPPIT